MKRILSYLFLSSCLFLSCNTDESDELLLSANVKVENADDVSMFDTGNEQVVIPDSVAFFNTIMPLAAVEKKSEISPYVYDYKVMSDIGYDRIEYSMHNQTINLTNKYSGEALRTLGLPQSIYIVDVLRVYKTLSSYKPKAKILPKDPDASLNDMGKKTDNPYNDNAVRGWIPGEYQDDGDGVFEGVTYVLKIITTTAGMSINKYFPCAPEDLVWNYECFYQV